MKRYLASDRMEIKVEGLAEEEEYDERNLVMCRCGEHLCPSKKMFAEFLERYRDIDAVAEIRSTESMSGEVEIQVTVRSTCPSKAKGKR